MSSKILLFILPIVSEFEKERRAMRRPDIGCGKSSGAYDD